MENYRTTPPMRGTLVLSRLDLYPWRIIPAHAGNTGMLCFARFGFSALAKPLYAENIDYAFKEVITQNQPSNHTNN